MKLRIAVLIIAAYMLTSCNQMPLDQSSIPENDKVKNEQESRLQNEEVVSLSDRIKPTVIDTETDVQKNSALSEIDLESVAGISIFETENFSGSFIANDEDSAVYLIQLYTIDKELSINFLKNCEYINKITLWKGHKEGRIIFKNRDPIKIKISYYGNFFSIEGEDGYYVIDDSLSDEWEKAFSFDDSSIDLSRMKNYDAMIEPIHPAGGTFGHAAFFFSDEDSYITCSCHDIGIFADKIYDIAKLKYNQGIKLTKFIYEESNSDSVLELLYEDGTYLKWDQGLYTVTHVLMLSQI